MARILRVVVAAILLTIAGFHSVAAQEPTPEPGPAVTLEMVGQPLWHGAGDRLHLRFEIVNLDPTPIEGFRIFAGAYDRVSTRSGLAASQDIDPSVQLPPSSFSRDFSLVIPAEGSVTVDLDDRIETLDSLARATESGVYPISISMLDASGVGVLATTTVPLIFHPRAVDVPLNVVPVVPLNDFAARSPSGTFVRGDGSNELEQAVAEEGWLSTLLSELTLRTKRELRLGLAASGRLIDELADMADGYRVVTDETGSTAASSSAGARGARAAIQSIEDLMQTRGVQPILVSYSFADLPQLGSMGFEQLAEELSLARRTITDVTGVTLDSRWLLPPAGRIDASTLEDLKLTDSEAAARTFFSTASLVQPLEPFPTGCPSGSPTWACPVSVQTVSGQTIGYQSDEVLQDRLATLANPGDDRLDLQWFFAETAMIREELPGVQERVVQFSMPGLLRPPDQILHLFFKGLAKAPWLNTTTPAAGLELVPTRAPRDLVEPARPAPHQPAPDYFERVTDARAAVDNFGLIQPPQALIDRLKRDVLVAYSRNWWGEEELLDRGLGFAEGAQAEAQRHIDNINVLGAPEITMTSRRGEIQLLLSNGNDFPVTVAVRLSSPNLELANDGVVQREFPPNKSTPVTFAATAQASGIFPVEVQIETPRDGVVLFGPTAISIRSTELNRVAVGITLGALAFLIAFYAFRRLRPRGGSEGDARAIGTVAPAIGK